MDNKMVKKVKLKTLKYRDSNKKYYQKNKEKILSKQKEYYKQKKKEIKNYQQRYNKKHEKRRKYYYKNYWEINKKEMINQQQDYYEKNREKKLIKQKTSYQNNKEKISELIKNRRQIDKNFAIKDRLRSLLRKALRKYTDNGKIMSSKKYGIDYDAIIECLRPFPEDLSKYHVDHIKPLCSFDLTNPEEVKKAFDSENLQWLLAEENLSKGGRWV